MPSPFQTVPHGALPLPCSTNLEPFPHQRHSPIYAIGLDGHLFRNVRLDVAEDHFQMLAFALVVAYGQDAYRGFEDADLGDAGAGIAQDGGRVGVHGQRGHFGDGVPAGGTYAWNNKV